MTEQACSHGILGACTFCGAIARAESAEAELRETAGELERIREQSESWRRGHNAWQRWAETMLAGLQPEGGQHGDEPAREIIGARLTEATALLERLHLQGHSPVLAFDTQRFLASRAPAQPIPLHEMHDNGCPRLSGGAICRCTRADATAPAQPAPTLLDRVRAQGERAVVEEQLAALHEDAAEDLARSRHDSRMHAQAITREQQPAAPDEGDQGFVQDFGLDTALYVPPLPQPAAPEPAPMHLECPECKLVHVDSVDAATGIDWSKRPHKTHLCLGCGALWKPAEFPTVGMPAAPEPEPRWPGVVAVPAGGMREGLELNLVRTAAPEPSAFPSSPRITPAAPGALSAVTRWVKRAESAEAQLAAVREAVERGRREAQHSRVPRYLAGVYEMTIDKIALIVTPGGGTGEGNG